MKPKFYYPLMCAVAWMFILFLAPSSAHAQDRKVTGKVVANDGPVPGATILLKGSNVGTSADANGAFTINVSGANPVLVISAIGYKPQEVTVGNQSVVNVKIEDDVNALTEVIVTGYSIDSRRETTGAVSTVKAKDLTVRPSGNVEQQLQGRVAGLTVITNGQPGTASQVRVRGFGAFGGNEPLYVVDGVPVGSTDFLAPDDIETTTVLKDAAAASIYGARAANGVIVYTTKKGSKGAKKLNISYDGMYGVTLNGEGQKMMNPTDFATWTWNAKRNSNEAFGHPQFGSGSTPVIPDYLTVGGRSGVVGTVDLAAEKAKYNVDPTAGSIYQVVKANKEGTDWYKAITRNAALQRHSLGFSGGGENSRFYIGFGAQNQQGILKGNDFTRYTFRANSEFNVLKNVRIGQNLQFTYRSILGQSGGAGGNGVAADENDILSAFRMPSIIPVYDEFGGYAGTAAKGFNNPRNPVASRDGLANNRSFNANGFGNIYAEWDPIPGLTLRSSLGGQYNNFYNWGYSRLQYENSENNSAFGYNEGGGWSFGWVLTNTATYKKQFGKHNVEVLAGQEALNTGKGRNMSGNGLNPFSTDINYVNLSNVSASGRVVNSSLFSGVNFYSLFGRVNYIFNDKYIITGVVRRDGSSRFGANNRFGAFPAFSAAWRISSEPFMKQLTWVSDLKIRGGYGTMGNSNNVDPNNQFSLYGASIGNSAYDINGSNSSTAEGYYRTRIGNPDAKWETSITKNIGIDGTFLNGKLDVVIDFWQKDTKDLLYQLPITATAGPFASPPSVNIAKMANKGIDILVTNRGRITKDLSYDITFTGGTLSNEIVSVAPNVNYLTNVNPGFRGINPIRNQVGYSISSFYGYKVIGLFQNAEEVKNAPTQDGAGPGRFRYADINGDGRINADDRTYLGSPVPKFTAGMSLGFKYKGWELEAYLNGFFGNKIFNVSRWFTDFYPSFAGAAISERVKESWTPSNTGATIPIFETASNFSTNTQSNSFYVENGSYVRFQNITLGYNLPASALSKARIQRLRVFASTNNIFTLTKYQGLDPGVGGNADTNFGIDVGNYPLTKGWTVGLNLGF
ncbi:SusC/RagA family TonB-linked outer membrane protein [Runella sp. CRIBMP]|uniref:SusC/RagA family TonB-linked outer membrane protein n=1 Tax=Runella sp. CRIBMP TaxID=2683261 RepID=UPI001412AF86|nr:SusC/RagA family TonB-linked outer membrane protein [Runella sp. CRIBMP]